MDEISSIDNASRLHRPNLDNYKEERPRINLDDSP